MSFTGRVPPGPEYSYLRFQQYQWDPGIKRLGGFMRSGQAIKMDPEVAEACGLGRRSWTEEEAVLKEIGEKNRVCELCGGRGFLRVVEPGNEVRCRRCQGAGVVRKEA